MQMNFDHLGEHDCIIRIDGLQVLASVGVYPHELAARQPLLVDIEMVVCAERASTSDDIRDALDYDRVVECVNDLLAARHFNLLEALSAAMLNALTERFPIFRLKLNIAKPKAISDARQVSVGRHFVRGPHALA